MHSTYIGRFAPSPTGPLHAGSVVAAVASYLDARAHHGRWLVRIEDIDEGRTVPGAAEGMLQVLDSLGMHSDAEVVWQSARKPLYQAAADRIAAHTFGCGCNRREIADSRLGLAPAASPPPAECCNQLRTSCLASRLRSRRPTRKTAPRGAGTLRTSEFDCMSTPSTIESCSPHDWSKTNRAPNRPFGGELHARQRLHTSSPPSDARVRCRRLRRLAFQVSGRARARSVPLRRVATGAANLIDL